MEEDLIFKAEESDWELVPEALATKPELAAHLAIYRALFWTLSNRRPLVGGFGPPMARMLAVQDIYLTAPDWGVDPAEFLAVTAVADGLYIEHLAEKAARASKRPVK